MSLFSFDGEFVHQGFETAACGFDLGLQCQAFFFQLGDMQTQCTILRVQSLAERDELVKLLFQQ